MADIAKKKGFVIFDTKSKRYYCKPTWNDDLTNAHIFKSIDDLKLMYNYFKQHPEYLVRHNIRDCDLVYRKVTLKVKNEQNFALLGDI